MFAANAAKPIGFVFVVEELLLLLETLPETLLSTLLKGCWIILELTSVLIFFGVGVGSFECDAGGELELKATPGLLVPFVGLGIIFLFNDFVHFAQYQTSRGSLTSWSVAGGLKVMIVKSNQQMWIKSI